MHFPSVQRSLFALLCLAAAPFASASFIVDPTGGSNITFSSSDDAQVTRNLGGTFSLYGSPVTSLQISTNGLISNAADIATRFLDSDLHDLGVQTGANVIAPFYDDLILGAGSTVSDKSVANTYYALTYQGIFGIGDQTAGRTSDFQVVLFMADTVIGGFQFRARDIAFSYGTLNSQVRSNTFTVGVANSITRSGTPASVDGQLTNFSTLPTGSQFLLYRPFAEGFSDYVDSIQSLDSTVPEPATVVLAGLGIALFAFLKRR